MEVVSMKNTKYVLNVLLRQKTRLNLSLKYEKEFPMREKSFSEFVDDLVSKALSEMI